MVTAVVRTPSGVRLYDRKDAERLRSRPQQQRPHESRSALDERLAQALAAALLAELRAEMAEKVKTVVVMKPKEATAG